MIKIQKKSTLGFTLIETIIYIGLFGLIFSGIFVSMYPIFTGAQRLTNNVAAEGEAAFILSKINFALGATMIDSKGVVTSPAEGLSGSELVLTYNNNEKFRFVENETNEYCVPPFICHTLTIESDASGMALPLNAQRVQVENFTVKHNSPAFGAPRSLDISFTANGKLVGPVRYYLHF